MGLLTRFPIPVHESRYTRQGHHPFSWITRGKVCYEPVNYTPTAVAGTAELAEHLCAHLRGIDIMLGGGPPPGIDTWETADGAGSWETADGLDTWDTADS